MRTIYTPCWAAVVFVLLLSNTLVVQAAGPVWKISKDTSANASNAAIVQTLFLGGTIHVLAESDYPLPSSFDKAYQQADTLVFEFDVAEMPGAEFQALMLQKTMYQDGTVIQQVLSPETYQILSAFTASRGNDITHLQSFKPGMLTIILTLNELQRLGLSGEGVDAFYDKRAVADNKPRLFFETIEQQLAFLSTMGEGNEDALVQYSLKELDDLSSQMQALKTAWRSGNVDELVAVGLTPWFNDFPKVYQSLLVDRNAAWLPKIETMLTTDEVEYVLVGALHLVGDDGLLSRLRERGYTVEQVQ